MSNPITNWSWDKPTEPGLYLACFGDIEVIQNIHCIKLYEAANTTLAYTSLVDDEGEDIQNYSTAWKFAKLEFGSSVK